MPQEGGLLRRLQRLLQQARLRHRLPGAVPVREATRAQPQDRPEVQAALVLAEVGLRAFDLGF